MMKKLTVDHSGKNYFDWTILEIDKSCLKRDVHYICQCKCGYLKSHTYSIISSGRSKCCRSCSSKKLSENMIIDLKGISFGEWKVLEFCGLIDNFFKWKCQCSCGYIKNVSGDDLRAGKSTKCRSCRSKIKSYKHGYATRGKIAPEYNSWSQMKTRCYNKNDKRYYDWGGRGITMYQPWIDSFEDFFKYIGKKPLKSYSIDRIDNDGNYEPGNVKWSSPKEQANNRRNSLRNKNNQQGG